MKILCYSCVILLLFACHESKPKERVLAVTDPVAARLDSFKAMARPGDLVFRLGDDMMSYSIRFLSEQDPSYSHVGIVSEREGALGVMHISPSEASRDTIHFEPIDSFLNPVHNLYAGLYRYQLSDAERKAFFDNISLYQGQGIHFDYWYDLTTNNKLYCSELIAKSLEKATGSRMHFEGKFLPQSMMKLMYAYFANLSTDKKLIQNRKYISLDQLYLRKGCDSLYKFSLRNDN
jgi:hypothetical protein